MLNVDIIRNGTIKESKRTRLLPQVRKQRYLKRYVVFYLDSYSFKEKKTKNNIYTHSIKKRDGRSNIFSGQCM